MERNLLLNSLKYVFYEHYNNRHHLINLAIEGMRQQTLRTSLGVGWVFVRDIIYFTAFISFRYLMAGAGEIEGMSFILFLMVGIIIWNFLGESIGGGVMSIKGSKGIIASIKMPISILPTVEIMSIFLKRLFTLLILIVVIIIFGDIRTVTWWMLIYYFFCAFAFMVIWNMVFAPLAAISNDFEQLYKSLTSILMFALPIMWSFENLQQNVTLIRLFKLNPLIYIIEGFRSACAKGILPDLEYTVYFWSVSAIMLCIGAIMQYKLSRHYIDLI